MINDQMGLSPTGAKDPEDYRFLTAIQNIFNGQEIPDARARQAFWNSVALYNYVQAYLPGREVRPTAQQFRQSISALCEVVTTLRPSVLVVMGFATWDNLPNTDQVAWIRGQSAPALPAPMPNFKRKLELWTAHARHGDQEHSFWTFYLPHPAAHGFGSGREWNEWYRSAMEVVTARPVSGS